MGFTSFRNLWSGMAGRGAGSNMVLWGLMSVLSLGGAVACGGVEQPLDEEQALVTASKALQEDNGLSLNGLSLNGLSLNGLSLNGLSLNGLNSKDFSDWFVSSDQGNMAAHDTLMKYMVRCALPEGQNLSFTTKTGQVYVWAGGLGLAPRWTGGAPASEEEQQIISACLAAHTNNYGVHVAISVMGRDALDNSIPVTSQELTDFNQQEACFFGNVFKSGGSLFAGNFSASLSPDQSTSRPCGLTREGQSSSPAMCAQMVRIGQCATYCTLEPNNRYYSQCTYGGKTYKPITTRISTNEVHTCGDGVCQLGELPGTGLTADSCRDCLKP